MKKQRIALVSLALLGIAAAYLAVTILASAIGWAVAHADTGAAATVPLDATSAIAKYGWVGGVLVAYVAVRWLLLRNETEHWIAQGRTLSIVTAVVSVIGSVVGWRLGMSPDTIGMAAAGAIPLAIPSTVTPKPSPVTASGEVGGGTP